MQTNVDKEALKNVTKIVSHAGCADGFASAMICSEALDWKPEVVLVHYNSPELAALEPEPGILFVDFCPPADRADEFLKAGAIVLDHHKGVEDVVMKFVEAGQGAFADEDHDPGVSGASLAESQCYRKLKPVNGDVQNFANLAGIRDTWQTGHKDWEKGVGVALMLRFFGWKHFEERKQAYPLKSDYWLADLLGKKHSEKIKKHCDERVIVREVRGRKVAFHYDTDSLTSDVDTEMKSRGVFILIGFFYVVEKNRPKIIFKTRSSGDFSVRDFCKYYGGNGHTHAAGFSQQITNNRFDSKSEVIRFSRPHERDPFDGEQNIWYFAEYLFAKYLDYLATKDEDFAPGV